LFLVFEAQHGAVALSFGVPDCLGVSSDEVLVFFYLELLACHGIMYPDGRILRSQALQSKALQSSPECQIPRGTPSGLNTPPSSHPVRPIVPLQE
jgi:hypothetical protein